MNLDELFWNASLEEVEKGYTAAADSDQYICLICGQSFVSGYIYKQDETLMDARKAVEAHINEQHGSMFTYLIGMDKKYTGLTDHQKRLLEFFYYGYSDKEIMQQTDATNTSTIRNQRFKLKEREKQARVFLAIMGLWSEKVSEAERFIDWPRAPLVMDERFAVTAEENEKILEKYFRQGKNGILESFPTKEKRRISVIRHILSRFDRSRVYTEKEVNSILADVYHDYVLLRRCLIDYGFMDRLDDGSKYWVRR